MLFRSCLYAGAKTRVRVGSEMSEEFDVKVGVHQESVLSPLVFAIVVDVIHCRGNGGAGGQLPPQIFGMRGREAAVAPYTELFSTCISRIVAF